MKKTTGSSWFNYSDILSRLSSMVKSSLVINAFYILGVNLLPAGFGFFYWGIASRLYTVTGIGYATGFISAVILISGISVLGTNVGMIRFLPDSKNPKQFLNTTYTFIFLNSLVLSVIYLLGIRIWSENLATILNHPFSIFVFILYVIVNSLGNVTGGTFVARKQSNLAFLYRLFAHLFRIILVNFIIIGIIGSTVIGFLLALLINLFIFLPRVEKNYRLELSMDTAVIKMLVPFSAGNYLADFLSQLGITILPLMILEQLGAEANGIAYIPLLAGSIIASPGASLGRAAFVEGSNSITDSNRTLIKGAVLGFIVTLLISLAIIIIAPYLLRIFGENFVVGTSLLRWMAVSAPVFVLNQFYFNYLRLQKNLKSLLSISGLILLVTVGMSASLLPGMGIAGVGVGVAGGNLIALVVIAFRQFVSKRTGQG